MANPNFTELPSPNDKDGIEQHKRAVLEHFHELFALVDQCFQIAVPKANDIFALAEGPQDRSVHSSLTRYFVKVGLMKKNISAEETAFEYEMQRVSNCGLCVNTEGAEIRILKESAGNENGIPKSNSDARLAFYRSNQMTLFDRMPAETENFSITLVLTYGIDSQMQYSGLVIACPRDETDTGVDCFWIHRWSNGGLSGEVNPPTPTNPPDLDEIRRIDDGTAADKKKAAGRGA